MAKTNVSHRNIVLILLSVGLVYQGIYQAIMMRALRQEERDECSGTSGGGVVESPQCVEQRLFRLWAEEDSEDALALTPPQDLEAGLHGAAASDWEQLGQELKPLLHLTLTPAPETHAQLDSIFEATLASMEKNNATTAWAQSLKHEHRRLQEKRDALPSAQRAANDTSLQFERLYNATLAALVNKHSATPWARSLETLMAKFEERKSALPSTRRQRAREFDALYNQTLAAIHNRSKITPWAQHLEDIQAQLQGEMDALPSARRKHAEDKYEHFYNATMAIIHNSSEVTPWGKSVMELQQRLQAQMDALPSRHRHAHHAVATPAPTGDNLLDRINQLGREMCQEPARRHRLSCAQFLAGPNVSRSEAKAAWRAELRREEKEHEADLNKKLAELTAGRKEWEMAMLTKLSHEGVNVSSAVRKATTSQPAAAIATSSSLRGGRHPQQLRWRSVTDWSDRRLWSSRSGPLVAQPEQLEMAKWAGKIPAVTCVTAVPSGRHARSRMQYFVDNFKKQTYEGPHQLVMLYHASDHDAAKLVHQYADGFFIKGMAARGSEPFPSTTAMRYAAWGSEADVIARWDLYEFHHPDRLSMQVRAMASAARPGCALKRPAHHQAEGSDTAASEFWEESLIGEARWMQKYWHPFLGTPEQSLLEGAQGYHMVEVELTTGAHHGHHHAQQTLAADAASKSS